MRFGPGLDYLKGEIDQETLADLLIGLLEDNWTLYRVGDSPCERRLVPFPGF